MTIHVAHRASIWRNWHAARLLCKALYKVKPRPLPSLEAGQDGWLPVAAVRLGPPRRSGGQRGRPPGSVDRTAAAGGGALGRPSSVCGDRCGLLCVVAVGQLSGRRDHPVGHRVAEWGAGRRVRVPGRRRVDRYGLAGRLVGEDVYVRAYRPNDLVQSLIMGRSLPACETPHRRARRLDVSFIGSERIAQRSAESSGGPLGPCDVCAELRQSSARSEVQQADGGGEGWSCRGRPGDAVVRRGSPRRSGSAQRMAGRTARSSQGRCRLSASSSIDIAGARSSRTRPDAPPISDDSLALKLQGCRASGGSGVAGRRTSRRHRRAVARTRLPRRRTRTSTRRSTWSV